VTSPGLEKRAIWLFLALWSGLAGALFLHASGRIDISLFHFPQAKGSLILLQEGYKQYNFVGLREEVYALKQGVPFTHPKRRERMQKLGIFTAYSVEEARRMVDAGRETIEPRLVVQLRNFHGYNLYRRGERIYAVPAMDAEGGTPLPVAPPYSEQDVGADLEEAKRAILSKAARAG
jgi:hypothetical protein